MSDVMLDQVRAIDDPRLIIKAGRVTGGMTRKIKSSLAIVFDLE